MKLLIISCLFALLANGCSRETHPNPEGELSFVIKPEHVTSVSVETLEDSPDFKAQLHVFFNEAGVLEFGEFTKTNAGKTYDLLANGEILLRNAYAQPRVGKESWFFVESMNKAKHFAHSLTNK